VPGNVPPSRNVSTIGSEDWECVAWLPETSCIEGIQTEDYHNDIFDYDRQSFPSNVKRRPTRRTSAVFHHGAPGLSNDAQDGANHAGETGALS